MSTQRRSAIKIVCLTIVVVVLLLMIAGCDSTPAPATGPKPPAPSAITPSNQPAKPQPTELPAVAGVAAKVNGQDVSLAAYQQMVDQFQAAMAKQGVDPNTPEGQARLAQVKQQILDSMIDDVLIAQEAAKQGVAVSDADLDAAMQKLMSDAGGQAKFEQILAESGQTLADARVLQRTQMLDNLMRDRVLANVPKTVEQIHARHILVDSPATAQALLAQIQAGADFGELAKQSSQDPLTKANGGDLGWFPRGTLIAKEVEDAAFALQPGQVSNVVQSAFGYHLVQLLERDPARALEGDQLVKVQQSAVDNWLNGLRAQAKVERLAGQ